MGTRRLQLPLVAALLAASALAAPAAAAPELEQSFGDNGRLAIGFGARIHVAGDIAAYADGRLAVSGLADGSFAAFRLTAPGALDPAFGTGGRVQLAGFGMPTGSGSAPALAIQPDGKLVLGGSGLQPGGAGEYGFALARLLPDGTLDPGFGSGGKVVLDIRSGHTDNVGDLALQADGKILASGNSGDEMALARFEPDGTPDAGFGSGGRLTAQAHAASGAPAVAVLPDGAILAAGSTLFPETAFDWVVWRFLAGGTPDTAFGGTGWTRIAPGPGGALDGFAAHGLVPLPDGRFLLVGSSLYGGGAGDVAVGRVDSTGAPDRGFAGDGTLVHSLAPRLDRGFAVLPAAAETWVAADYELGEGEGRHRDLALLPLDAAGTPGEPFRFPLASGTGFDDGAAAAMRPDGRIAVLATIDDGAGGRAFGVALVDPHPESSPPPPPPPPAVAAPRSRIAALPARIAARRSRAFRGTARAGRGLARVDVALVRLVGRRCEVLTGRAGRFRRARTCRGRIWLRATGRASWRFTLNRRLRPGRYVLFSRATDVGGRREQSFSTARGNRESFRVR